MRRFSSLVSALALAGLFTGCVAAGANVRQSPIRPASSGFLETLTSELRAVGFDAKVQPNGRAASVSGPDSLKFIVTYDERAARLMCTAFFNVEEGVTCDTPALVAAIMSANEDYNVGKLYCDTDDDTVGMQSMLLVPENGFSARELARHLEFVTSGYQQIIRSGALGELLK